MSDGAGGSSAKRTDVAQQRAPVTPGDFHGALAREKAAALLPFWTDHFRKHWFPNLTDLEIIRGRKLQLDGVDFSLFMSDKTFAWIDNKYRFVNLSGFLLEYLNNDKTGAPSWAEDPTKRCHYLHYPIMPTGEAWLFTFPELQSAWGANKEEWLDKAERRADDFRKVWKWQTGGYNTVSVVVPRQVLIRAVELQGGEVKYGEFPPQTGV